ncbi:MSCRAMM family protein [Nocardioides marmoribigeumensis]|uniref:Prealbumin-like fold domain-containing protein n=1 Tax=Nocardioides marmoribigeumensis TaxID=433649 RepID=A0ABU2BU20_9ACTN|nr:SpaA isopeptide-forming pilin-related protein [Nocardioides marmoribigeumensis]MDR7361781.1 hypothetical protein [Nocardioides marmoribigeumensis]
MNKLRTALRSLRRPIAATAVTAVTVSGLAMVVTAPAATAATTGDGVSYTLEGCRNNGDITLPIAGKFICPTSAYTTGNLGKGWNELDLVPARVTVAAGNSAPSTQNLTFALVVDYKDAGKPGYDVLSEPVLNAALSSGTCGTASVSGQLHKLPGLGGTDDSLYRTVSVTGQAKNSRCVYDAYARLALGSHLYSGSSLHFNLTNDGLTTAGIGSKEVSIPVNEILPQDLTKSMNASQGTDYTWGVSKRGPARVDLGDTCAPDSGTGTAEITVTWTKNEGVGGMINVTTTVTAVNPASRPIDVSVTDLVYGNDTGTGTVLQTLSGSATVPANTSLPIVTASFTLDPDDVTGGVVSDRATATYTDEATGVAVPGNTTAFKTATVVQGSSGSGDTAVITDDEWWSTSATGVSFSVAAPSTGSFTGGYVAGTPVSGATHVGWSSGSVDGGGSVTFTKTITSTQGNIASAVLSDVATASPTGGTPVNSDQQNIDVDVDTTVALGIRKTIPNDLTGSETQTFDFVVKNSALETVATPSVTFTAGEFNKLLPAITGLAPDQYTVSEVTNPPYVAQTDQSATLDGFLPNGCSGELTFNNRYGPATAKATKLTVPDTDGLAAGWVFTLSGPGTGATGEAATTDANGVATFTTPLQEGTYTITETAKSGWDQTGSTGCSFTVNYPEDADQVFDSCQITNTQRGALKVHKTVNVNDAGGTLVGTSFNICIAGPSYATPNCKSVGIGGGDVLWTDIKPGTYTVTEQDPGIEWIKTISPSSVNVAPGATGSTAASTVTNTRKGKAKVVKTVSASDGSGKAAPSGSDSFAFKLCTGATKIIGHPCSLVESGTANAANGGVISFAASLTPGSHYQLCETLPAVGWEVELGATQFVPEQFLADGTTLNPGVVNDTYCVDFVAQPGPDPTVFNVNNRRPPGGSALTIGYWKNWSSCTKSALKKKNSLDQALFLYGTAGMVVAADNGGWPLFDPSTPDDLKLYAGSDPNKAVDCAKAVALLNKSTFTGKKMASDPAFNMAAQLVAAQLNYKAGAATTVTTQINQAVKLLGKYNFNGNTHATISAADKTAMNALATTLDKYNNNVL